MPLIAVTPTISIDADELTFSFARASGPGGQNVNKVETAVDLRFDLANSPSLDSFVKARLVRLAGRRLTQEGVLLIQAQSFRSQERNRQDATDRLLALIRAAAERPKFRVKTRPTLASKQRRVDTKVKRGSTKALRKPPSD